MDYLEKDRQLSSLTLISMGVLANNFQPKKRDL